MGEIVVCHECGDTFDEDEEGDGDVCDECVAIAEDEEGLMYGTISDETIQRIKER